MNWKGSKLRTSPAIWQAKAEASNAVMRSTPLLPASRDCQTASVVLPTEQIRPMPVMTTRLCWLNDRMFSELAKGDSHKWAEGVAACSLRG